MRQLGTVCLDGRIMPDELAARTAAPRAADTAEGPRRVASDLPTPASDTVAGTWHRVRRLAGAWQEDVSQEGLYCV
jgi:hypothetical protein